MNVHLNRKQLAFVSRRYSLPCAIIHIVKGETVASPYSALGRKIAKQKAAAAHESTEKVARKEEKKKPTTHR